MRVTIKNMFNDNIKFKNLEIEDQEEILQEFNTYINEAGWEDWMNEYTEASEDEEISEIESEKIEKEQARRFLVNKLD
jgi:hypothetical protein